MNYQEILCYPYVINLINVLIIEEQEKKTSIFKAHKPYKINLVKNI